MAVLVVFTLLFCMLLTNAQRSETSTTTLLQLRDSVHFSYSTTNFFLDVIRGENLHCNVVKTAITAQETGEVSFKTMRPVLSTYVGYAVCIALGFLFAILMPIVGLIFCCCRFCGRCGGRVQLMDKRKDPCKRIFYTVCLVAVVTLQLVATVLAFINHFLLHEALVNPHPAIGVFSQLNSSLIETDAALKEIVQLAKNTSSVNLEDRKLRFYSIVNDGFLDFQHHFVLNSRARDVYIPIKELQSNVSLFLPGSPAARELADFSSSLQDLASELPQLRNDLVNTMDTECSVEVLLKCQDLMNTAKQYLTLRYSANQFQMSDISGAVQALSERRTDIDALNEFNDTLNTMSVKIGDAFRPELDKAWTDLANSPETREKLAHDFEHVVHSLSERIRQNVFVQGGWQHSLPMTRFVHLHLYTGIALFCIPVLIFLLAYFGLCFGTCGNRPYEEAGLCNRGVGANLLIASVVFIFLFSSLLMLVCMAGFAVGGLWQTELCRYLTERVPEGPLKLDTSIHRSLALLQKYREQPPAGGDGRALADAGGPVFDALVYMSQARVLDAVLNRCRSEPLVEAFSGGELAMPMLSAPVQGLLQQLVNSFVRIDFVKPLRDMISNCLAALQRASYVGNRMNLSPAIEQLSRPLTNIDDLARFIADLSSLKVPSLEPVIERLYTQVLSVDHKRSSVQALYTKLNNIRSQQAGLQSALLRFQDNLPDSVNATLQSGLRRLQPLFQKELQLAVIASWSNIPCTSLQKSVKRGVDAVCLTFLMPFNAAWAGLGLTLLLFIPAIVFSVKLASLYRKTEKYSPDYEEPDYISYHAFYMRPTSDYQAVAQGSRSKARRKNVKSTSNGSKARTGRPSQADNTNRSRYHQVSVYPYDSYE